MSRRRPAARAKDEARARQFAAASNDLVAEAQNLEALPSERLTSLRRDVSQLMSAHQREAKTLQNIILRINRELIERGSIQGAEPMATDHAVVRYLERVVGLDIEGIRETIKEAIDGHDLEGKSAVNRDGVIYCLTDGRVQTILTELPEQGDPVQ